MREPESGAALTLRGLSAKAPLLAGYRQLFRVLRTVAPRVLAKRRNVSKWDEAKFIGRALLYKRWMFPWCVFLKQQPQLHRLAEHEPELFLRIQWPYINRGYRADRRLELICAHYRFMLREIPAEVLVELFSGVSLTLAEWNIRALGLYRLTLRHAQGHGQEGEMALNLERAADSHVVYFLQFTVGAQSTGEPEMLIGCLQGGAPEGPGSGLTNKTLIAHLTRRMYGSRPKNLLLFALRRIAANWNVSHIRAVSTERHVFRQHLHNDYNAFWREIGGTPDGEGMFAIPRQASSLADVDRMPAKRRPLYRRRCRLWEAIGGRIDAALQRQGKTPATIEI